MIKIGSRLLFTALLTIAAFVPAYAWDETGHKITAYIAWQRMTPETRARVLTILAQAPEDSSIAAYYMPYGSRSADVRKREYFVLLSSWADFIKDKNIEVRYKKYNQSNWHYSDTFWQYKDGKAVAVEGKEDSGKALEKIAEFDGLIRSSSSDADKAIAIAWLIHLIGDIHQPLHTSAKVTDSNARGDQGGNLFYLTPKGTKRDQQVNLHSFWDSIVPRSMPNDKDLCDTDYIEPFAREIMKSFPYDKEQKDLKPWKFDQWIKESFDIATTEVYKGLKFYELPSDSYKKKALEISRHRMALAGYRMGDLFNSAFGAQPMPAPTPSTAN